VAGNAGIVASSNEAGTTARNDVELCIALVHVEGAADFGRQPIPAISAATRKTDPVGVRDAMAGIAERLI
jgi:hypothetical protein